MDGEYLQGVLAPVADELDFDGITVEGEIPEGMRGTYLRNGPNPQFQPLSNYHLWDGDGMIHALTFGDEGVSYRNRWVATGGLGAERKAGQAIFTGMQNLGKSPFPELVREFNGVKNVANTNIVRHAGRYLALWEAGLPTAITADLDTIGSDDFAGKLPASMTAHPKIDPVDGEMLFFNYSPLPPFLQLHTVDASGKLVRSVEIDLPGAVMMHDFVMTREHVVFVDSPAVFDIPGYAQGGAMMRWQPDLGTRIGVMPRKGSNADVQWIEMDNFYCFHFLNAWTEGDFVHITGCCADWLVIDYKNEVIPDGIDSYGYLCTLTLNLKEGTCKKERIGELPAELPKIPDAIAGLKNRYGYLASFSTGHEDGISFDSITKYDLESGSQTLQKFGDGTVVGEPVFVPDPKSSDEDGGWVGTYVHQGDGSASEFVVLDARNFADGPIARVKLPRRVPAGFHGNWMSIE